MPTTEEYADLFRRAEKSAMDHKIDYRISYGLGPLHKASIEIQCDLGPNADALIRAVLTAIGELKPPVRTDTYGLGFGDCQRGGDP